MILSLPGGGGAAGAARRLLAGFFLSLLALLPAASSVAVGSAESFTRRLDARISGLMRRYEEPGLGIALIRDGGIVWQKSYGIAAIGWAASRPYLMVTSLFPGPAERAGGAVLALSSVLLFSALFSAPAAVRSARF